MAEPRRILCGDSGRVVGRPPRRSRAASRWACRSRSRRSAAITSCSVARRARTSCRAWNSSCRATSPAAFRTTRSPQQPDRQPRPEPGGVHGVGDKHVRQRAAVAARCHSPWRNNTDLGVNKAFHLPRSSERNRPPRGAEPVQSDPGRRSLGVRCDQLLRCHQPGQQRPDGPVHPALRVLNSTCTG